MRLTKNDMARVIVQALYNMPALPAADDRRVMKRAAKGTVASLTYQHKLAMNAIQSALRVPQARTNAEAQLHFAACVHE